MVDKKSNRRRVIIAVAVLAMLIGVILIAWLTIDRKGFRAGDGSSDVTVEHDGSEIRVGYLGDSELRRDGASQYHSWMGSRKIVGGPHDGETWSLSLSMEGQPGRWGVAASIGFPNTMVVVNRTPWVGPGEYDAESSDLKTGAKSKAKVRITIRGVP